MKITDFGLSTYLYEKNSVGMLDDLVGTYNYMAPELNEKRIYSGKSVDVFALGVILFCMRFKQFPFGRANRSD